MLSPFFSSFQIPLFPIPLNGVRVTENIVLGAFSATKTSAFSLSRLRPYSVALHFTIFHGADKNSANMILLLSFVTIDMAFV